MFTIFTPRHGALEKDPKWWQDNNFNVYGHFIPSYRIYFLWSATIFMIFCIRKLKKHFCLRIKSKLTRFSQIHFKQVWVLFAAFYSDTVTFKTIKTFSGSNEIRTNLISGIFRMQHTSDVLSNIMCCPEKLITLTLPQFGSVHVEPRTLRLVLRKIGKLFNIYDVISTIFDSFWPCSKIKNGKQIISTLLSVYS